MSDALGVIYKVHKPPAFIRFIFNLLSIRFLKKVDNSKLSDEEKLCNSIQQMGTSFIKLGQFLSTRPDIIGDKLSSQLEKLQDRVPPFSKEQAIETLKIT